MGLGLVILLGAEDPKQLSKLHLLVLDLQLGLRQLRLEVAQTPFDLDDLGLGTPEVVGGLVEASHRRCHCILGAQRKLLLARSGLQMGFIVHQPGLGLEEFEQLLAQEVAE